MNYFKTILGTLCFALLLPITTQAQEDEGSLRDLTTYTVKFGHNTQFTEGVKMWSKCYRDNNGIGTWNVYHRLQGEGNVYVVATKLENWAEMGKSDAAGKACRSVALELVTPHIESRSDNNSWSMPEYSRKASSEGMSVIWVTSFKVNDSEAFLAMVKDVTSTIAQKEGDKRGYWFRVLAGEGSNYYVSTPFKDFADLDTKRDNVWKLYESVHGEKKTKEIRAKFRSVVDEQLSYTYTLEADLSQN